MTPQEAIKHGKEQLDIFGGEHHEFIEMAIKALEQQPKIGHWILADEQSKEDTENNNYRFICSECGCADVHAKSIKVPYCWSCGVKMEVEE